MFITFLGTNEMVGCDDCNPDWNIVIMTKLFLPPSSHFSILVPLVNHHQIYFPMAACNHTPSKPFMISLLMHKG